MNSTETPQLTVPLGSEAHAIARQFAAEQTTPQKGKKTYLNTLAVYAVHSYLKWLQIETELSQSDSWHPGLRSLFDVADLVVPSQGKLECRPVLPGETTFLLPPEVAEDRIGYVAVQFDERLNEVQLLGFARAVDTFREQIFIADLQPLDVLLGCIPSNADSKMWVNLSRWLQNNVEAGWQTLEDLFSVGAANPAFSFRNVNNLIDDPNDLVVGVSRGKLIDLGTQLVILVVTIEPVVNEQIDIGVRVYPADSQHLPQNLQLIVLNEFQETILDAQAGTTDDLMQLELSGEPKERFSVKVALEDVSITEHFVI